MICPDQAADFSSAQAAVLAPSWRVAAAFRSSSRAALKLLGVHTEASRQSFHGPGLLPGPRHAPNEREGRKGKEKKKIARLLPLC